MSVKADPPTKIENKDQPYWSIFEAVSDGSIIHDSATKRIVEANSAAAAMHGYSREEFIGLPLSAYVHPDSQSNFTDFPQVVVSGGVIDSPGDTLHLTGRAFYVEVRRTAFIYQSHACVLSILHDVKPAHRRQNGFFYRRRRFASVSSPSC